MNKGDRLYTAMTDLGIKFVVLWLQGMWSPLFFVWSLLKFKYKFKKKLEILN